MSDSGDDRPVHYTTPVEQTQETNPQYSLDNDAQQLLQCSSSVLPTAKGNFFFFFFFFSSARRYFDDLRFDTDLIEIMI
jgi:hypothetical protein